MQDNRHGIMVEVHLSREALRRFRVIEQEVGRGIQDLLSDSAEEQALMYFRGRKDDPVKESKR